MRPLPFAGIRCRGRNLKGGAATRCFLRVTLVTAALSLGVLCRRVKAHERMLGLVSRLSPALVDREHLGVRFFGSKDMKGAPNQYGR
jgi:hypothetical protein